MTGSALYPGVVAHARVRPRRHRLRYRIFQVLLDLDELSDLDGRLRLFSVGRFNLVSFQPRDHLDGGARPLRERVGDVLSAAGVEIGDGRVQLLCMPRILGHAFNPISVYFCHRPDGVLAALLYEVNNTFGERHSYLIPVEIAGVAATISQRCDKAFFVSPFMPMDLTYVFHVRPPGETVGVDIEVSDGHGPMLFANFGGRRQALTDGGLIRAWLSAPLLSLKVVAGIHWEALWIWLKGVRLQRRPTAPADAVSVVKPTGG